MANDFKRICTPNVSASSNSTIYAVPAGASSAALESIVIGITILLTNLFHFIFNSKCHFLEVHFFI